MFERKIQLFFSFFIHGGARVNEVNRQHKHTCSLIYSRKKNFSADYYLLNYVLQWSKYRDIYVYVFKSNA